jgi:hypothetical protein
MMLMSVIWLTITNIMRIKWCLIGASIIWPNNSANGLA